METPHETVALTPEQIAAARPSPEQLQANTVRNADLAFAATAPLPGPAGDAFAALPRTLLGFTLLPVTGGHIAILQTIQSPFLMAIRLTMARSLAKTDEEKAEIAKRAESCELTIDDIAEAMFVFTRPPAESRKILNHPFINGKRDEFRAMALAVILDNLPPLPNLDFLGAELGEHYARSFSTALDFEPAKKDAANGNGGALNFPPAPSPKTASAGSPR